VPISATKTKIVAAFGKRKAPADPFADATLEFGAETGIAVKDPEPKPPNRRTTQIIAATVLVAAMGAAVYWADRLKVPTAPATTGSLKIETDPAGAEVRIDGKVRGTTPLSLSMATGDYLVTVQQGGNTKELPVSIATGATTVHHLTWTDTAGARAAGTGSLTVTTDQPGGQVNIDGQDRGATPLTVRSLPAGQHRVVVRSGGNTITRTVQIGAGVTASLVLSTGVAPWGWVTVASPVTVQLFEGQRLIGTSDIERIMLPNGEHDLEIVADQIGYRATRRVRVSAGQAASVTLDLPKAAVSINAIPWAEVLVDGTRLGETPLGNVSVTPGPHEFVFRHPQLGERRITTVVSLKDTNRISMDMRSR
jgi:hypothetical protein